MRLQRRPPRRSVRLAVPFLAVAWIALAAADAPPPCVPLPTAVHVEPWRATLSWPARATPSPYFVEYRAGKFPTQLTVAPAPGAGATVTAANLLPGATYVVEVCEPRVAGGCPAHDAARACTTAVTVVVPRAYAGVKLTDPDRAVCETEADVASAGEALGGPATGVLRTGSAAACCEACAAAEPRMPYVDACRAFEFDARTGECRLARGRGEPRPAAGVVSGRVVAWPRRYGAGGGAP